MDCIFTEKISSCLCFRKILPRFAYVLGKFYPYFAYALGIYRYLCSKNQQYNHYDTQTIN